MTKFMRDFKSQVSCLPGPVKNDHVKETGKLLNEKSYEKSDIFHLKKTNNNFQPQSEGKKKHFNKNIQSNEYDVNPKISAKPGHIKNFFGSQIFN